jgi:hypothetical protein
MSLRLTYIDHATKVHNFTVGPGTPTGDDLTHAQDIVFRASRRFLYPVSFVTKQTHTWSWLVTEATLQLEANKDEYLLPADFESLHRPFMYTMNTGRYGSITKTSMSKLMQEKSFNTINSWPLLCSIFHETVNKAVDQHKKVMFWPIPSGVYQLNYSYICEPPKPTVSTDIFLGDCMTDEALLQVCLAVAEQQDDEIIGIQSQLADQLVQALILKDSSDAPETVGYVRDGNLSGYGDMRSWSLKYSPLNTDSL